MAAFTESGRSITPETVNMTDRYRPEAVTEQFCGSVVTKPLGTKQTQQIPTQVSKPANTAIGVDKRLRQDIDSGLKTRHRIAEYRQWNPGELSVDDQNYVGRGPDLVPGCIHRVARI